MTDQLITDLAKVGSLRVISRTSVMQYKGAKKGLPEIARELNVDAIVEGSVIRSGQRVRITAQLLQARTDRHLWAETYDRDLGDILKLQSEVSDAIAQQVRAQLTPTQRAQLRRATRLTQRHTMTISRGVFTLSLSSPNPIHSGRRNISLKNRSKKTRTSPSRTRGWRTLTSTWHLLELCKGSGLPVCQGGTSQSAETRRQHRRGLRHAWCAELEFRLGLGRCRSRVQPCHRPGAELQLRA